MAEVKIAKFKASKKSYFHIKIYIPNYLHKIAKEVMYIMTTVAVCNFYILALCFEI